MKLKEVSLRVVIVSCIALALSWTSVRYAPVLKLSFVPMFIVVTILSALVLMVQIVVRQFGHYIFGVISGYEFTSIQLLNWVMVSSEYGIQFKRYHVPRINGQCIMKTPDVELDELPYTLYLQGGNIANGLLTLFLTVIVLNANLDMMKQLILVIFIIMGLVVLFVNAVPHGLFINDTEAVRTLRRSIQARDAYVQLSGFYREQFDFSDRSHSFEFRSYPIDLVDNYYAFLVNYYYLYQKRLEIGWNECLIHLKELQGIDVRIPYVYRMQLELEINYLQMRMSQEVPEETEQLKRYINGVMYSPQIVRYLYLKSYVQDGELNDQLYKHFEIVTAEYPFILENEMEREIMNILKDELT